MKTDLTDVTLVIDASGSMYSLRQTTIDNINEFIEEQRKQSGLMNLTIYQFNSSVRQTLPVTNINDVKPFSSEDYYPSGMTALLDGLGITISQTGERLAALETADRPSRVLIALITDGNENSSYEYSQQAIADAINHQQDKYNWSFAFMGANIDEFSTAGSINIDKQSTRGFKATHTDLSKNYQVLSRSVSRYRQTNPSLATFSFTDEDNQNQKTNS